MYDHAVSQQARDVEDVRKDEQLMIPANINYLSWVNSYIFPDQWIFKIRSVYLQKHHEPVQRRTREIGNSPATNGESHINISQFPIFIFIYFFQYF